MWTNDCRRAVGGIVLMVLACLSVARGADAPVVSLPDTPAGKEFGAWVEAMNSGNRERMQAFVVGHMAPAPRGALPVDGITDRNMARYADMGGIDVRKVNGSAPDKIAVAVQSRRFGYWYEIQMAVTADEMHRILGTGQAGIEPPVELLPNQKLSEREIGDRVDALITKLVNADAFSGVILIAKDGKPIYERAAGMANRTWNAPNRMDTKFNLASVGKMFTAVAAAQLLESGKLSLDDTVGKILPNYPNADVAKRVTVRHLLSHTSGLPSGGSESKSLFEQHYRSVNDYLPSFAKDSPAFEPGTKFLYSNCGYYLLGAIIEKASGENYYDYVRAHIFKPAGMNDTDNYDLDTDPPNVSTGYMDAPGGRRLNNTFQLPIRGVACGLGYATAGDMVKFDLALRHHVLLNEESLKALWTGRIKTDRTSMYGFGCYIREYNGTRIIWHGGGWVGITNQFDIYPELGYTVVILNNIDSNPTPLALTIRGWLTQGIN